MSPFWSEVMGEVVIKAASLLTILMVAMIGIVVWYVILLVSEVVASKHAAYAEVRQDLRTIMREARALVVSWLGLDMRQPRKDHLPPRWRARSHKDHAKAWRKDND